MRPAPRLIALTLVWALLGAAPVAASRLAPALSGPLLTAWALTGLVLALVAALDLARGRSRPAPRAERRLPSALSVQVRHRVRIDLVSADLPGAVLLADEHPGDDGDTGLPTLIHRARETVTTVEYGYRPAQRGRAQFGRIRLWLASPLGLWSLCRYAGEEASVPIYPDFSLISADLEARYPRTRTLGQRLRARTGEGLEFHQLREYQPGDSPRRIDWKATARRRQLISREYQDEQNQQLVALLDGGRRLALPVAGLTGFDHALNASLLLSWSALAQGDRPGALMFSGETERWIPPVRGRGGIHRILNGLYDLHPGRHASDFTRAARRLHRHCPRRTLVVLITRLQPDDSEDLLEALKLLGRRHLVLIGDMRLPAQAALAHEPVADFETALRVAGDAHYEREQRELHTRLRHAGATVIEATPRQLPARLNAAYLQLKRAGRL